MPMNAVGITQNKQGCHFVLSKMRQLTPFSAMGHDTIKSNGAKNTGKNKDLKAF